VRAAAISVAAAFAFLVVLQVSLAGVLQYVLPFKTLAWAPNNAIAQATMAARLQAAGRLPEARTMAIAALQRDSTTVAALRTLALTAEAEGDQAQALRLIDLAHDLSRRDLPTQLWLISHSIRAGDLEAAVHHFDLAMRTSTQGSDQLIPLLVAATGDERLLPPLSRLLARNPSWKLTFLSQLGALGPRPDHNVWLTRGRLDPALPEEREAIRSLISRLAGAGRFDLAWQLYHDVSPGVDAASLRSGNFEGSEGYPPFDWSFADDPDLSALRISRPDGAPGYALSLLAQNSRTGDVARQVIRLAPGAYRLEYDAGAVPASTSERPVVSLTCPDRSEPILALRPDTAREAPQRVGGMFSVPTGCTWQSLSISISGSGSGSDATVSPWIDNIAIRRAG